MTGIRASEQAQLAVQSIDQTNSTLPRCKKRKRGEAIDISMKELQEANQASIVMMNCLLTQLSY